MNVSDTAHTQTSQKYIISIWCKVLIKVQQPLIKVPSRTYWTISRHTIAKLTPRRKIRTSCSSQNSSPKIETDVFHWPGGVLTFSSLIILGISEIRVVSFVAVLCMFKGSSTEAYSAPLVFSLLFCSFPFHPKYHFQ